MADVQSKGVDTVCVCPNCGLENPEGVDFCLKCAGALGPRCPTCRQPAPPGSRFCGQCGAPLSGNHTSPSAVLPRPTEVRQSLRALMPPSLSEKIHSAATDLIGERREVTVLFSDIVNFTATAHILDSEDVYLLTDEAMRLLIEVIYQYEGTVDKFIGDGLLALFGLPVAHENDPERAVRAALDMQRALRPLQERIKKTYGLEFQTRIGIHTGLVIAGKIGNDLHMEYTVIGDTVNLAYRLQGAARPGTVAVSFATYQRTRPLFKYAPLSPFAVKGMPRPIHAFRPVGLRAKPERTRGLPGLQVAMVGRQSALQQLQTTLAEVTREGHSRIVLVTGEAGVGKTRLIAEFRQSLAPDVKFYQGSCMTYARQKPLWLLANLLRDMLHLSETDPTPVQLEALRAHLDRLELNSHELFLYLSNALGLAEADPRIEAALRHLDNPMLQKLTHAALRRLFLAEARRAPTILVFDDLHWIDPASREFLEFLIQSVENVPLMLVLVSRDTGRDTVIQPLLKAAETRHDRLVDIPLPPLSKDEGQLLVSRLIPQTSDEAQVLKRRIVERAEGNPFYAEEIIRMLIEHGGLVNRDGAWQVTSKAEELMQTVPGTLNGLILARFDPLPIELRRTLQKASVLGTSFPVNLLASLNGTNPKELAAQLAELEARQFLTPSPVGAVEGYSFRHALIQEVVYNTLLKRDRKKLHERAAQVIEQEGFWPAEERIEAVAYHYAESTNPTKAVPYLIAAGEHAARRCAYEIAIQHYRRALTLLEEDSPAHSELLSRARLGLGQALKLLGRYTEAARVLEESHRHLSDSSSTAESASLFSLLLQTLKELADLRAREGALEEAVACLETALKALGDEGAQTHPSLWRQLIDRLAWVRFRQGKLEEAFRLASSATLGLEAVEAEDPATLASLYNTLGGVFWRWGDLSEATNYVERSLELYRSLNYAWGMAVAHTNLGVLHYAQGKWPQAARYLEQAHSLRAENGYLSGQALTLSNLGLLRMAMGDHEQAQRNLEESLALSQRLGDDFSGALAHLGLGQLGVIQGRFEEAAAHIQAVLNRPDAVGEDQMIQARWLWALIQAEQGELPAALETAEQALQLAREAGLTEAEANCRRVLGILQGRSGNMLEAEALLREAVDLYLQVNAPYGRGLALLELARLYQRWANPENPARHEWRDQALAAVEAAMEQFEALGASHDLQQARQVWNQLQETAGAISLDRHRPGPDRPPSPPDQDLPEGEWRTATIVWLKLIPPPEADEEAVFETLAFVVPALTATAQEHRGRVLRRPDGLTLIFGAPTAYEDDAEQAVQTAWELARCLHHAADGAEVGLAPLSFGLAVSQGQVVAGRIGPDYHSEFVVEGEAVQVAQQVAETAPRNTIWVTEKVQSATRRLFDYTAAPPEVKASLGHLPLWKLVGLRDQPDPVRGLPGLKARLIGRETLLQTMTELARNLERGLGGLIWIEGEPGIGKSRLMQEFAASMAADGALVWTGRCSAQRANRAFSLFSDLFSRALNLQPTDTPDQIRDRLHQAIQRWPRDVQIARPYLEVLLGVQPGGLEGERLGGLKPEQLRQQLFVALRRLFKTLANEQPLVLLLDDLHWVDPISAELLQFLLTTVTSAPVLFVCAQRRQGADSPNDRLVRAQSLIPTQTIQVRLERLSAAESEALLSELLPQVELPTGLRRAILQQSDGNPYFIEEYVRTLIAQGFVQHRQGRWVVDPQRVPEDIPLPSSLETLIRSRVDALPPELKQVMQYAAVVGSPFEVGVLEMVVDQPNVKTALARLESRLLVQRSAEGAERWEFNHSLIETVIYNSLLKARRQAIHLRLAQALEARWAGAEAEHAEQLAYHYTQAGESTKALTYLVLAGERAAARYANEEARSYFELAAQQLHSEIPVTDDFRWRIAAGLGDVYRELGQYAEARDALQAGLALAETGELSSEQKAGLHRRLGETALKQGDLETAHEHLAEALSILGEIPHSQARVEVARVLTDVAWIHFVQGHFDRARAACESSLAYAREADALSELASAENLLGGIYYRQSEWTSALHHTMRAMILREQMGYTWGVASSLGNLGVLAVSAGHWSKARSFFERSLTLRQEIGDMEGVAITHNNLGTLARDQGDLEMAESHFRESLAVARLFKLTYHIANAILGLAQVLLLKGEIEAARQALAASREQAAAIGAEDMLTEIYRVQAEIRLAESAWDEAQAAAEKSASLAAETGNRSLEAAAWRVLSEIALHRNDPNTAARALTKAQQALADVTDELEAGRVAAQAGRLHLSTGQFKQAETELRMAQEIFMRLGASLDLKRVEQALKESPVLDLR